ncbi:MAG TPA: M20 family metallopeptidase [Usitatibacter sp.]|jgi:succinyl-diaminopimelate desuccinylase|nr:M20 family metallopeptidase [Usitatibacter sp.]
MKKIDPRALTRELLAFNTINPPGMERACARHLGALLEEAGFRVAYHEFAEARTSLVATIGGSATRPPICFTGHIDVVPLGAARWTKDPFAGESAGDRLFGRGATDMKSGIAAFVAAACELAPRLGSGPGLVLVITAGEEIGCEGAKFLADHKLLERAGAIVVAEPTANYPYVGHKGLAWFEIETHGVTAHGSMPEVGDNAIVKMAHVIGDLDGFRFPVESHAVMGKPTLNVGTIRGGLNTNSVPDEARITVDTRTVPGIDHVHLCQSLESLLAPRGASVRKIVDTPALYTEPANEWVLEVFEACTPFLGGRPTPRTITFSTDGADLKRAFGGPPAVILGPGEPTLAHQTDEWCSLTRLEQSVDLFRTLMQKWCST